MSSEFNCSYCSACPRHPCYSEDEAAHCPNVSDRGHYLKMDASDVTTWMRHNAKWAGLTDEQQATIEAACQIIDEGNF